MTILQLQSATLEVVHCFSYNLLQLAPGARDIVAETLHACGNLSKLHTLRLPMQTTYSIAAPLVSLLNRRANLLDELTLPLWSMYPSRIPPAATAMALGRLDWPSEKPPSDERREWCTNMVRTILEDQRVQFVGFETGGQSMELSLMIKLPAPYRHNNQSRTFRIIMRTISTDDMQTQLDAFHDIIHDYGRLELVLGIDVGLSLKSDLDENTLDFIEDIVYTIQRCYAARSSNGGTMSVILRCSSTFVKADDHNLTEVSLPKLMKKLDKQTWPSVHVCTRRTSWPGSNAFETFA